MSSYQNSIQLWHRNQCAKIIEKINQAELEDQVLNFQASLDCLNKTYAINGSPSDEKILTDPELGAHYFLLLALRDELQGLSQEQDKALARKTLREKIEKHKLTFPSKHFTWLGSKARTSQVFKDTLNKQLEQCNKIQDLGNCLTFQYDIPEQFVLPLDKLKKQFERVKEITIELECKAGPAKAGIYTDSVSWNLKFSFKIEEKQGIPYLHCEKLEVFPNKVNGDFNPATLTLQNTEPKFVNNDMSTVFTLSCVVGYMDSVQVGTQGGDAVEFGVNVGPVSGSVSSNDSEISTVTSNNQINKNIPITIEVSNLYEFGTPPAHTGFGDIFGCKLQINTVSKKFSLNRRGFPYQGDIILKAEKKNFIQFDIPKELVKYIKSKQKK